MRDFSEFSDKIAEKARNLLVLSELHASKTTAFTEKSSILSKSRETPTKNVVKRLFLRNEQAKERLQALRALENERRFKENTGKPQISENSRVLLGNSKKTPLFLRTGEVLRKRNDEIEKLRRGFEEKTRENVEKELTFRPETLNVGKKHASSEEMLEQFDRWRRRREEKIEKIYRETLENELKDATFHPAVNELSKKLAERRRKKAEKGEKTREEVDGNWQGKTMKVTKTAKIGKNNSISAKTTMKNTRNTGKSLKKREDIESNKENVNNIGQGVFIEFSEGKPKTCEKLEKTEKPMKLRDASKKSSRNTSNNSKTSKSSGKSRNSLINVVKYEPSLSFLLNLLKKP